MEGVFNRVLCLTLLIGAEGSRKMSRRSNFTNVSNGEYTRRWN
jgi:hypothetical protein